jgi:uncharacterized protein YpmB
MIKSIATIIIFCTIFSSCSLFKKSQTTRKENNSDSTNVKKSSEVSSKVDTSKTKTETIHTKETIYQPQPIYVKGKDGETKIVFVPQSTKETGTSKEETQNFNYENTRKELLDSIRIANLELALSEKKESKTKIGPSFIEWILIGGLAFLILKNYLPFKLIKT